MPPDVQPVCFVYMFWGLVCVRACESGACDWRFSFGVYVPAELLSEGPFVYRQGRLERSRS